MPKSICVAGGRLRALSTAAKGAVLTDLDASSFAVRRQERGLPGMQALLLDPDGFSLGYVYNAELHFVDPDLQLAGTMQPSAFCVAFAEHCGRWVIACRNSSLHCFSNFGKHLWTWEGPAHDQPFEMSQRLATETDLILVAKGPFLYALTPRDNLLWDWEVPQRDEQPRQHNFTLGGIQRVNHDALRALGLSVNAGPDEVRQAYRRMARLTHPDFNQHDFGAANRFRAVRSAYEALQRDQAAAGSGGIKLTATVTLTFKGGPIPNSITALTIADGVIGIGTSKGDVYLCDRDGKVLVYHPGVGRNFLGVSSLLLRDSGLDAAVGGGRVFRFNSGAAVAANETMDRGVGAVAALRLVSHGDDVLAAGNKTLWIVDRNSRVIGTMTTDRKISAVVGCAGESIVLTAGRLMSIPHR
jgi:hypothetical protein